MQFFDWLRESDGLKTFEFADDFEDVELGNGAWNGFDEHGIRIGVEGEERRGGDVDLRTHVHVHGLEVERHSVVAVPR